MSDQIHEDGVTIATHHRPTSEQLLSSMREILISLNDLYHGTQVGEIESYIYRNGPELVFSFRSDLLHQQIQRGQSILFRHKELCEIESYIINAFDELESPSHLEVIEVKADVDIFLINQVEREVFLNVNVSIRGYEVY